MPEQPSISVIIPVHAVEEYLNDCLDSVLGHATAGIEVIAVDDASPDRSGAILDARASQDPRLRVVHLARNAGPGNARNAGHRPLHAIQIEVLLLNQAQQSVARAQTYCGNDLSPRMFDEMTPRELEFSLGLNPPKNFSLDLAQSTPFMLVFLDPPRDAKSLRIAVTQADPAAEALNAATN